MSYLFINRYCKLKADLPELGIVVLTGWIIQADAFSLSLLDDTYTLTHIKREHLFGSIVVIQEQKPVPEDVYRERSA